MSLWVQESCSHHCWALPRAAVTGWPWWHCPHPVPHPPAHPFCSRFIKGCGTRVPSSSTPTSGAASQPMGPGAHPTAQLSCQHLLLQDQRVQLPWRCSAQLGSFLDRSHPSQMLQSQGTQSLVHPDSTNPANTTPRAASIPKFQGEEKHREQLESTLNTASQKCLSRGEGCAGASEGVPTLLSPTNVTLSQDKVPFLPGIPDFGAGTPEPSTPQNAGPKGPPQTLGRKVAHPGLSRVWLPV